MTPKFLKSLSFFDTDANARSTRRSSAMFSTYEVACQGEVEVEDPVEGAVLRWKGLVGCNVKEENKPILCLA